MHDSPILVALSTSRQVGDLVWSNQILIQISDPLLDGTGDIIRFPPLQLSNLEESDDQSNVARTTVCMIERP